VFVADTIGQCVNSGLKQKTAAQMSGVTARQVQRKVSAYKINGYESLLNCSIYSKPVNAIPAETK
jgi:hypothetical protein